MFKKLSSIFVACIVALLIMAPSSIFAQSVQTPNIPIYRAYLPANGEHLYTPDHGEVERLVRDHGWVDEGLGWYAPRLGGEPVYRIFNPTLGNHLYTTDAHEVEVNCAQNGWTRDNNGNPLFSSGGETPIYRLYNAGLKGMHHLTVDANEYNSLPAHGWTQEGAPLRATTEFSEQNIASGNATIENTPANYAIEANVTLSGSGSGYHAKLVACTATSALSFGIQYDQHAVAPYTDQTTFLYENVAHNAAGGQRYERLGLANRNQSYRLMLAVQGDGTCDMYVNGAKVGSSNNPNLAGNGLYLRVEGSGRLDGDSVNATFSDIKVKHGDYNPNKTWGTYEFKTNQGLHVSDTYSQNKTITVNGTITGLNGGDWDSKYNDVSDIIQFVE